MPDPVPSTADTGTQPTENRLPIKLPLQTSSGVRILFYIRPLGHHWANTDWCNETREGGSRTTEIRIHEHPGMGINSCIVTGTMTHTETTSCKEMVSLRNQSAVIYFKLTHFLYSHWIINIYHNGHISSHVCIQPNL